MRRETAFSPESAAGSSEADFYRISFCTATRREAELIIGLQQERGRLSPHQRALPGFRFCKFIGNWTVLQIMSGDLG